MAQEAAHRHEQSHSVGDAEHHRAMLDRFDIDEDEVDTAIGSPGGVP